MIQYIILSSRDFTKKIIAVKFYRSEQGREPVKEWLLSLCKEDRKIIGSDIKVVEYSFPVGMPLVKKIDSKRKLWEVRGKLSDGKISRVIFTIYKDCMILLHGFIKKDKKIPKSEIDTAILRLNQVNLGECDER